MNLVKFYVSTTNIFPAANSTAGGQLLTEFNIRARDSVATSERVKYMIGPSYVHAEEDYYVRLQNAGGLSFHGEPTSICSTLEILPGRAIINGYFVENLVPMTVDMIDDVNAVRSKFGEPILSGPLTLGLRIMFSEKTTMAGTIDPENSDGLYEGVQVVILPDDEFKLPSDVPDEDQEDLVTAHIKLATFTYRDGKITNIVNNYPDKCKMISASRIGDLDSIISGDYVRKNGLNPRMFYAMAGKGTNPSTGYDTWCDVTSSLIVWDNGGVPKLTTEKPPITSAMFGVNNKTGATVLTLPHKQMDVSTSGYELSNSMGMRQYYKPVTLPLPKADFNLGTSGTVDAEYTNHIKEIVSRINTFYGLTNGKQRGFVDVLNNRSDLPTLNPWWSPGDYILVKEDFTFENSEAYGTSAPSTIYVVLPGRVLSVGYDSELITAYSGVELSVKYGDTPPNTEDADVYSKYWGDLSQYRGAKGHDYFTYQYTDGNGKVTSYMYGIVSSDKMSYSDPVQLTGGVPLAGEDMIGGFLNVPETATDMGYVYLDGDGHLRVLDYAILRSGTAAYQLGEDFTTPSGLSITEIQSYLDEYVNQRIAFPNSNQMYKSDPNVININLNISAEDDGGVIDIYDIDSRFNTSICIHINGNAGSNVEINISDCARVQIDPVISGSPTVNLYRSSLYYDYSVLDYLSTIKDMTLWYVKRVPTDPDLVIDGMTVRGVASDRVYDTTNLSPIEYWSDDAPNDNHFTVALQSLTFGSNGYVSGCSVLVRNSSTSNISIGKSVIHDTFEFSQGPALFYPKSRLLKPIKVTGSFVSAYTTESPEGYVVQNTTFSMQSPCYGKDHELVSQGEIAFFVDAYEIPMVGASQIDVWDCGGFHHFSGTTSY